MTENEKLVFGIVKNNSGVSVSQAADSLGMNNGSVLYVMKSLMEKGLVFRAAFGREGKGCGRGTSSNFFYFDSQEKSLTSKEPRRKNQISVMDAYRQSSPIYRFDQMLNKVRSSYKLPSD